MSARSTESTRSTGEDSGNFLRRLSACLSIGEVASAARKALRYLAREAANAWATRRVMQHAAQVLVCTREEARRLQAFDRRRDAARVDVIPHFVEPRPPLANRAAAKRRLKLQGRRIVSVLGFIHRRKGHDFVVNALPHLPPDVTVLFIGRAGRKDDGFLEALRTQAEALGVTDRLRITGYVPDEALDDYLAATDVAVCPFREASASGSLSTWIAAGPPLVTSDVPLFAEYNALVPGTLQAVDVSRADALAMAIRAALREAPAGEHRHGALRQRLSLASIAAQHERCYRRLAPLAASSPPA
jgi:glycosyltransferase involved in cell wall biosynthesis